jgi:hypothetical protein
MKTQAVKLVPGDPNEPLPAEVIQESIVAIASAMRQIEATRLSRRALVTLIHDHSKVNRKDIELVLNNLEQLEVIWLKPKR